MWHSSLKYKTIFQYLIFIHLQCLHGHSPDSLQALGLVLSRVVSVVTFGVLVTTGPPALFRCNA